jgi:predicted transposase YbfD/YdcC
LTSFITLKKFLKTNHYISSLISKAITLAKGIRQHWGIKNRLNWVKDVIFGEDMAAFGNYNAATSWSIIRNIAINLARKGGYNSLNKAERFLAHDIDKLFLLLE